MTERYFSPNSRYLYKMMTAITLTALLILAFTLLLAALISLDDPQAAMTILLIFLLADAVFWLIGIIFSVPYFRSMRYEIQEDEVIVHVGILTHSTKHVPYRTVTNLTVKRDILDRWIFNLGSLHIQTAGMSGQTGAEEKLAGLENVQEIYDMVVTSLRRYRGGMLPTQAEEEPAVEGEASSALLEEVRAIRALMENRQSV